MTRHEAGQFKFVGKDGSLGLRNGAVYNILLSFKGHGDIKARISAKGVRVNCPYSSLRAFMRNWTLYEE